ncbi:leucine--tRNA ligase [Candidatus Microgenomates bacterium]|jgi:leucyl-tRNA synthetase|nr:MAG: leucine--tRNA ligase [Candidatus Microgenomates bacterium]
MAEEKKERYYPREIEPKWIEKWREASTYKASDFDKRQKKYVLVEFPYPSGFGLHVGHAFAFTGGDVLARFFRMKGYNVLFPMGWDAFGLPTENYAIKEKRRPQEITRENTTRFKEQMQRMGLSFDWEREINTTDPDYYKWTQWIFIELFKKGLAYKAQMPINWCPSCKIGLANEEVINGKCERCGAEVTKKNLEQWIVKITDYADRLINGLEKTNFVEKVKAAQINWIGKKEGAHINFPVKGKDLKIRVFTTRPDTLYGATFMVLAPELSSLSELTLPGQKRAVEEYIDQAQKKTELERTELTKKKTGCFTGSFAINPINGKEIPIWVGDFVLSSYGTGAIMGVPAHDERDFDFAQKYGLPVIPVIEPPENDWDFSKSAYTETDRGTTVNSELWNGVTPTEAIKLAIKYLEEKSIGKKATTYHLRDWIFSRQHYWGEPIPMVFCEKCGWQPVEEKDLPVRLPPVEEYEPTKTGESPLASIKDWTMTKCPSCRGKARRETDTMPNWAGSDWYFLRYIDPKNNQSLADQKKLKYWLPVDIYIGGDEHNTLHLLYSRFIYQFLWDIGVVPKEEPEPYYKRVSHGVILGLDGQRMSKSRGNVVNPDEIWEAFGADALRVYLMFIGPFDATMVWSQESLEGVYRFLKKVWNLFLNQVSEKETEAKLKRKLHQTIKKVGEDIGNFKYNTAVAAMMEFANSWQASGNLSRSDSLLFLKTMAPFAPFLAEELWSRLGEAFSIHATSWPEHDPKLIEEERVVIAVQINGKLRETLEIDFSLAKNKNEVEERAKKSEKVEKYLKDKELKKTIFVPGKLINFVVS